jgi:hypothetical protein
MISSCSKNERSFLNITGEFNVLAHNVHSFFFNLIYRNMTKVFFLTVIVVCLGMGSCKKDKDDAINCASWSTEIQAESTAFSNAVMAYGASQTAANCTALKTAGQAYVNALNSFSSCADTWTAATKTQWQTMVTQTESSIATMCK